MPMADDKPKPKVVTPEPAPAPQPKPIPAGVAAVRQLATALRELAQAHGQLHPTASTGPHWARVAEECELILAVTEPAPPTT